MAIPAISENGIALLCLTARLATKETLHLLSK